MNISELKSLFDGLPVKNSTKVYLRGLLDDLVSAQQEACGGTYRHEFQGALNLLESEGIIDAGQLESIISAISKPAPRFAVVPRDSEEWNRMWLALAAEEINAGDPECIHPLSGDGWQYMGTCDEVHSFRHRNHPKTGSRERISIPIIHPLAVDGAA